MREEGKKVLKDKFRELSKKVDHKSELSQKQFNKINEFMNKGGKMSQMKLKTDKMVGSVKTPIENSYFLFEKNGDNLDVIYFMTDDGERHNIVLFEQATMTNKGYALYNTHNLLGKNGFGISWVHAYIKMLENQQKQNVTKFEIGKKFPLTEYLVLDSYINALLNDSFFDIVCITNDLTTDEKRMWNKGEISVFLFEKDHIPYICVNFDNKWSVDVNINILTEDEKKGEQFTEKWLNSQDNMINLYLVESTTGILEGMRTIAIPFDMGEKIRDICELQTEHYNNSEEVHEKIIMTNALIPTREMIKNSSMKYKLKKNKSL
jgi:hypothetical protein